MKLTSDELAIVRAFRRARRARAEARRLALAEELPERWSIVAILGQIEAEERAVDEIDGLLQTTLRVSAMVTEARAKVERAVRR